MWWMWLVVIVLFSNIVLILVYLNIKIFSIDYYKVSELYSNIFNDRSKFYCLI